MTKEALKLALEALENLYDTCDWHGNDKAITAIKEALAQPEMRPDEISTDELIYMNGLYDGMKQERALWELSRLGQEIEAAEPVAFAGVKVWVGNQQVVQYVTQTELRYETQFWLHMMLNAEKCIAALKEITHD